MASQEHGTEVNYVEGLGMGRLICIPMALRAAMELNVFQIIAEAGPGAHLSPSQIASKIPTSNPNAPTALNRILRILGASSILSVKANDCNYSYGLTGESKFLVPNKKQVSIAPLLLLSCDKAVLESFLELKHVVLEEGCVPFDKFHGVNFFEYAGKEPRLNDLFNKAMSTSSSISFEEVLKVYQGFNEVQELLDVGGGIGTSLSTIISKYPHVRGINFDLSEVIADAPDYPGVNHVAGDMFERIPNAQNILLKWVLHDWGDDHCTKLLKKCWEALPHRGKVIVVEIILPQVLENNSETFTALVPDLFMMLLSPGGKERTLIEYEELAMAAGFQEVKAFPISLGLYVLEFIKK